MKISITDKRYKKILINISTYISFVLAYIVYGFGLFSANDFFTMTTIFLGLGLFGYVVFEVVINVTFTLFQRFVPTPNFTQTGFKYYTRLLFIARNIVLALLNIVFIFNPVLSIWGIKISHVVFTIAVVFVGAFCAKEKIKNYLYNNLMVISTATVLYLIGYLFLGVIA